MMSRLSLLVFQLLVAVVVITLWYVFTRPIFGVTVLPPFFFSNPVDVAARIVKWFADGTIWRHLWITLLEAMLAFVIGSAGGRVVGYRVGRPPRLAACVRPLVTLRTPP